ncbi:MAG: DNA repair protein RadC [Lentimonas sp.]|jgi:DNA repair protein RadC
MNQTTTIKSWAEDDRPREKLKLKGRHILSDSEVLAILLSSGTREKTAVELAQEILQHFNNDFHSLSRATIEDLKQFKGVGEAKAITIVAALEMGRRRRDALHKKKVLVTSSKDAFDLLQPFFMDLQHEEFYVIYLDRSNRILKYSQLSKGGLSGTIADGKIIFKEALLLQASGIVLAHNHPSGNLVASVQDKKLTKNLVEFGKMIGIDVLDHIIFTDNGYLSFSDSNLM